ncbi:efflux RND transporter periplasmic adaptor subunit [Parvibium lacunae]|uniref:Efflux RND transporter periplasmic adaptor subunit n=1 Tax=Parvibium lacunae TaxID=1888893 RepID=A0A368L0J5_9BURK|nr:efflux RND transporter periplasmic adaptor subunit [Parvibium lacunae]RCS57083.1 efflux RND transporter periplasmic adaptor subunit [Parvibium lacunae]
MKITRFYGWTACLALAVLAGAFFYFSGRSKAVETRTVESGELQQTIVATGRVVTPARAELGAQVTATIHQVLVREGEVVEAGQRLLTLRDGESEASLGQAQAAVREAQARLQQLKGVSEPVSQQAVRQAQANLQVAQADWQRTQQLTQQGFFSQARLDDAQRNLDTARAALASAQTQAAANQPNGAETLLAQARLAQAQAALAAAQVRQTYMRLEAPFPATVLSRSAEPGSIAQPGKVLLTLAQRGETRLYVNVDEKQLPYLRPGLAAVAVADAYPSQPIAAQLYFVAPAIDPQRGTVEVRLQVADPPAFLKADMTVSVEMLVGKKTQTLKLASDAIRERDSAQPYVLAIQAGRVVRVPVQLGLRGVGMVEILQGLAAGDQVISATANVKPGERVRPLTVSKLGEAPLSLLSHYHAPPALGQA